MSATQSGLSSGWRWIKLGDKSITGISAGGTPKRSVYSYFDGHIPWAKIGDLTNADKYILETEEKITEEAINNSNAKVFPKGTVLVSMYGSIGKAAIAAIPIATNQAIVGIQIEQTDLLLPEFVYYFLASIQPNIESLGRGATQNNINAGHLKALDMPLPLLPVQERIVQILQKADEIWRKRQEAVALLDATLPATFIDMFGTPEKAIEKHGSMSLGDIADVRSGVTKGRKLGNKAAIEVPYLRVANVQDGYLDLREIKTIEVLPTDVERYQLEDGDILMTEGGDPDKLGRGCIWRNEVEDCIHQNHIFRVRTQKNLLLSEVLAALLRSEYSKDYFLRCAKRTSNLATINSTQVKAFPIPAIPVDLQQKYVVAVEQWNESLNGLTDALNEAEALCKSLMQSAFTGELTAEWEAANAAFIVAKQQYHQRLPCLITLAFLREKHRRTQAQTHITLVTALMKYLFLFQMEGTSQRKLYQFVPYHYGPFAKDLYTDLEALQQGNAITIDNTDEDKTRITLTNPDAINTALDELTVDLPPEQADLIREEFANLQDDVATILDTYGDLDHNTLLTTVYEKYPAYAKNSKVKQRRRTAKSSDDAATQNGGG